MKYRLIALLVFILQLFLVFRGRPNFGVWVSPFLITLVTVAIPYLWWKQRENLSEPETAGIPSRWTSWIWALAGSLAMLLCGLGLAGLWKQFANPRDWSDVLPQLEALYYRYMAGEFPYAPVDMGSYSPFPVYMPMHWLPIGLSDMFNMDTRWSGFAALVLATGVFGYFIGKTNAPVLSKAVSVVLPSLAIWSFVIWGELDIPVSYELIIAAYYLVLGTGLMARNWLTLGIGLILCLLSRYTLVFWTPLLAILVWMRYPRAYSYKLWGAVALSLLMCYMFFYAEKPDVWVVGIKYHNEAAVDEWKGYGDPPVSYSMERGIHFARHMKAFFSGEMTQRVFKARVVQATVMLGMLAFGLLMFFFADKKRPGSVDPLRFSLMFLYGFVWAFYLFGPLTYRYYLVVPMMLSAVITAMVWCGLGGKVEAD